MSAFLWDAAYYNFFCFVVLVAMPLAFIGVGRLLKWLARRLVGKGSVSTAPSSGPAAPAWPRWRRSGGWLLAAGLVFVAGTLLYEVKPLWLAPPHREQTLLLYLPFKLVWLPFVFLALRPVVKRRSLIIAWIIYLAVWSGLTAYFGSPKTADELVYGSMLGRPTCGSAGAEYRCELKILSSDSDATTVYRYRYQLLEGTPFMVQLGLEVSQVKPKPSDFEAHYHWAEAALPPPDHYEYTIHLGPGSQGQIEFIPDYRNEGVPVWQESFTLTGSELESLYNLIAAKGLLAGPEPPGAEPPPGSSVHRLEVVAAGRRVTLVGEAGNLTEIYALVESLVPPQVWAKLKARQEQYRQDY